MPPKKAQGAPDKQQKAKTKAAVEDKTFGLKNKNRSTKVQKYVQQVQTQAVQSRPNGKSGGETKKELEQKRKEELAELFKPVQVQQKVPFGVDPKTILCQFFKGGTCTKGKSCKFSHDLSIERKSQKIDLYTDARDTSTGANSGENGDDTMDNWDQQKLEEVVQKKHGKQPVTDIVCKYFIQAVEERKYGWFWQCPNGDDCKYKHALPPGFILKDQQDRKKRKEDEIVQTLEEWIEEQRSNLPGKVTPVNLTTFNEWKQKKRDQKEKEEQEKSKQREAAIRAGKSIGASGRELFTFNPDLFQDDEDEDDEAMEIDYTQREEQQEEEDGGGSASMTDVGGFVDVAAFEGVSLEDLEQD